MRTQAAVDCRRELIERFEMDKHAPFVDVAKRLIQEDKLFVEFEIDNRKTALAFLTSYWGMVQWGRSGLGHHGVRPMPEEFRT